jgi:hypothetical protein
MAARIEAQQPKIPCKCRDLAVPQGRVVGDAVDEGHPRRAVAFIDAVVHPNDVHVNIYFLSPIGVRVSGRSCQVSYALLMLTPPSTAQVWPVT